MIELVTLEVSYEVIPLLTLSFKAVTTSNFELWNLSIVDIKPTIRWISRAAFLRILNIF